MKYFVGCILGGCIGGGLAAATDSWWSLLATVPMGIVTGIVVSGLFDD